MERIWEMKLFREITRYPRIWTMTHILIRIHQHSEVSRKKWTCRPSLSFASIFHQIQFLLCIVNHVILNAVIYKYFFKQGEWMSNSNEAHKRSEYRKSRTFRSDGLRKWDGVFCKIVKDSHQACLTSHGHVGKWNRGKYC